MVMVDASGFGGDAHGDNFDWHQIAYGRQGLADQFVHYWTDPKTGGRAPIAGLFEENCPPEAARVVQARLHYIGFVCERAFTPQEIKEKAFYCCNPRLFADEETARATLSHWPLRRGWKDEKSRG
jgi:hypothetical protein